MTRALLYGTCCSSVASKRCTMLILTSWLAWTSTSDTLFLPPEGLIILLRFGRPGDALFIFLFYFHACDVMKEEGSKKTQKEKHRREWMKDWYLWAQKFQVGGFGFTVWLSFVLV